MKSGEFIQNVSEMSDLTFFMACILLSRLRRIYTSMVSQTLLLRNILSVYVRIPQMTVEHRITSVAIIFLTGRYDK